MAVKTGDNLINDRIEVLRGNIKKDLVELMSLQGIGASFKFRLELIPDD